MAYKFSWLYLSFPLEMDQWCDKLTVHYSEIHKSSNDNASDDQNYPNSKRTTLIIYDERYFKLKLVQKLAERYPP